MSRSMLPCGNAISISACCIELHWSALQVYLSPRSGYLCRSPISTGVGYTSAANSASLLIPREVILKLCLLSQKGDKTHDESFCLGHYWRAFTCYGKPREQEDHLPSSTWNYIALLWQHWLISVAQKFVLLSDPTQKARANWEALRTTHYRAPQLLKEMILLLALLD